MLSTLSCSACERNHCWRFAFMADRNHTVLRAALIPPSPRRRDRPTCRISCAPCWRRCLRPRSGVRVAIDVDLEFVFKGNIVASINLSAMETDPGINPFCWEAQKSGACGASTSPVTATYSNGYTTLTFLRSHCRKICPTSRARRPTTSGLTPAPQTARGGAVAEARDASEATPRSRDRS